jgi:hypothetical protein
MYCVYVSQFHNLNIGFKDSRVLGSQGKRRKSFIFSLTPYPLRYPPQNSIVQNHL